MTFFMESIFLPEIVQLTQLENAKP